MFWSSILLVCGLVLLYGGDSSIGGAPDCGSGGCGFESHSPPNANNPSLGRLVKTHTHTQVTVACNKLEAAKAEVTLPFKTIFLMLTEQAGKVFEKSTKTARNAKQYVCLRVLNIWEGSSMVEQLAVNQ